MAKLNLTYYSGEDRYSDGDIEEKILQIVREERRAEEKRAAGERCPPGEAGETRPAGEVPPLSCGAAAEANFAVLYHLSPVRENILNWYPFKEGSTILDLGAGPGAVTGLLCRRLKRVVCVELSKRRAEINALRHEDCDNLEIMVGNLNDMTFGEKFDYVLLNGVFEYAMSFTEGEDPYGTFLGRCRDLLTEDGRLLIAIENRLGLKYFAGAPEDHTDAYMDGLKGYPGNRSVRTFSKSEWEALADRCGLGYRRFYYPWPDYKFPSEIFTDETLAPERFAREMRNYTRHRFALFPEADMAQSLCREGVMAHFANSFLLELSRVPLTEKGQVLYAKLNRDRRDAFATGTVIARGEDGVRYVRKEALCEAAQAHIEALARHEAEDAAGHTFVWGGRALPCALLRGEKQADGSLVYPYLTGESFADIAAHAVQAGDAETVRKIAQGLKEYIESFAVSDSTKAAGAAGMETTDFDTAARVGTGATSIPAALQGHEEEFRAVFGALPTADMGDVWVCPANADLIFDNIFPSADGVRIIDGEWIFDFPVPASLLLWRALNELYTRLPQLQALLPRESFLRETGIAPEAEAELHAFADHLARQWAGVGETERFCVPVIPASLELQRTAEKLRTRERTATLYADEGAGYAEETAIRTPVHFEGNRYEAEFHIDKDRIERIRKLRFDPLEGKACRCRLASGQVQLRPLNASEESEGWALFLTTDPSYEAEHSAKGAKAPWAGGTIRITGDVELLEADEALRINGELAARRKNHGLRRLFGS